MLIDEFLEKLKSTPATLEFNDTMAVIEKNYHFTETHFTNGLQQNEVGKNSGSCKIFAFAQLQDLTPQQTLACFGIYYRHDVLNNPEGDDHQNIRQFMINGWSGIKFTSAALVAK